MTKPTYLTLRVLTIVVALVSGACMLALMAAQKPADAAFPGENGKILVSNSLDRDCPFYIASLNPDGTGWTPLTTPGGFCVGQEEGDLGAESSPDGKKIAFSRGAFDGDTEVYIMNADGSHQRAITDGPGENDNRNPTWSPDGTKIAFSSIAFSSGNVDGDVYVVNADGTGEPRRITDRPDVVESGLAWSPDGAKLLYVSASDTTDFPNPERDVEIYAMNSDGSGVMRLTDNTVHDVSPDWSPDGTKIVFSSYRDDKPAIYTMNPDGSEQAKIAYQLPPCVEDEFGDRCNGDGSPVWSPDGTRIAFVRFASSEGRNFGRLHTMNVDGSGVSTALASFTGGAIDWAPVIADSSECTITGTKGNDYVPGTPQDDVICGRGGGDVIRGRGGDDTVRAGGGDDAVRGGVGADTLGGGDGDDVLTTRDGVRGNDSADGGVGRDVCVSDPQDTTISCI
jgi:Tol biopolymer transport system component